MTSTVNNELDEALVRRAVDALLKYEKKNASKKESSQLLGTYAKPVLVQVQLKKPIKSPVIRPVRVKIPYSMFDSDGEDHSICLFCRSSDKEAISNYISAHPVDGLTKVVSIDDVKKQYKAFKDRKTLLSEHTHFVCDTRIFSQLINLLGKVFGKRNHLPIPIDISNMDKIESSVNKAVHNSTYMSIAGQTITLRLGHTNMASDKVAANILSGVRVAVEKLDVGVRLGGVHSVHIKSPDSAALPIHFTHNSDIGDFVAAAAESTQEDSEGEPISAPKSVKKGKKNVMSSKTKKTGATPSKKTTGAKTPTGKTKSKSK
mmetsp:Transcript_15777/g.23719  ORF Transcript_15777/g.23719 Transcript_15777/m.23719 type:complete len:317 (+) Transcript_15777:66-1016(+)|eukprot:CAMPEP_0185032418 /NCGR_PEP_ID=MMETSP1103-20130426/20478_1 /TAXON_ID=36769 /ORGANISM="Paraphysomonas bandaiensis, Strain Caron Lab Isolate" /LENGTH=316 /DNA_ID=CAMNT_0027568311 /DNA_START=12 /DNA_END=962 /DNA_ORIENTATION=-